LIFEVKFKLVYHTSKIWSYNNFRLLNWDMEIPITNWQLLSLSNVNTVLSAINTTSVRQIILSEFYKITVWLFTLYLSVIIITISVIFNFTLIKALFCYLFHYAKYMRFIHNNKLMCIEVIYLAIYLLLIIHTTSPVTKTIYLLSL